MNLQIHINNLSYSYQERTLFDEFNAQVQYGDRIALVGRNGSGKSTLLQILSGKLTATDGVIKIAKDVTFEIVPQIIQDTCLHSGGEQLMQRLSYSFEQNPDIVLLDEPTNHLDTRRRAHLIRQIKSFNGTIIVASHDADFLQNHVNILWYFDQEKISIFNGKYHDYIAEIHKKRNVIQKELSGLQRNKEKIHESRMQMQEATKKSITKGKNSIANNKWSAVAVGSIINNAGNAQGKKNREVSSKHEELSQKLQECRLPEVLMPKFSLSAADLGNRTVVSINGGSVSYSNKIVLSDINLSLHSAERVALIGDNGSGKSTLFKAILRSSDIITTGDWHLPRREDIGYLDQCYTNLQNDKTVIEIIANCMSSSSHAEIRLHLNKFLFRKNEEVSKLVSYLSGGERALLSLAQIGAKTPRLLLLDEITNNIDIVIKDYIIDVLKEYPGTMIVISHDAEFLKEIDINRYYTINDQRVSIK